MIVVIIPGRGSSSQVTSSEPEITDNYQILRLHDRLTKAPALVLYSIVVSTAQTLEPRNPLGRQQVFLNNPILIRVPLQPVFSPVAQEASMDARALFVGAERAGRRGGGSLKYLILFADMVAHAFFDDFLVAPAPVRITHLVSTIVVVVTHVSHELPSEAMRCSSPCHARRRR